MPITEDRVAKLRDFGLSEYAARAYLALLDLGLTEARDISTLSRVPTSKIYHILEQLHEKGLVVVLPEFPKKYAPVPFQEYLDKLQREHEEAAAKIDQDREDLTALFSVIGSVEAGDRGGFTIIRGRRNVMAKLSELTTTAEREMLLAGSMGFSQRVSHYLPDLRAAHARGVRTRILAPIQLESLAPVSAAVEFATVRAREFDRSNVGSSVTIGVYDEARALVVHFVPDDGHLYQGNDTAIYTDHEGMVAAIRALVEPHWERAPSFAQRADELARGRAPEFTRFYGRVGDATTAFADAIAQGAREFRAADSAPLRASDLDLATDLIRRLGAAGSRVLALSNIPDLPTANLLAKASEGLAHAEVRHVEPTTLARFWLLDDREAFFSLARPATGETTLESESLMIHTNNPSTLRALRVRFDELWAQARPLVVRRRELEERGPTPTSATTFFRGEDSAISASAEVMSNATREAHIATSPQGLERLTTTPYGKAAAGRGVKLRVLTIVTPESVPSAREVAKFAEVRHVPELGLFGNSADGSIVFAAIQRPTGAPELAPAPPATLEKLHTSDVIVHSADPFYVRAFDAFFESAWALATPLETRLSELGAGEAEGARATLTPANPATPRALK